MHTITSQIAAELKVRPAQVEAAVALLDGGATVPFIARYRKEATGGLDDVQMRELEARLAYLRELHERRAAILKSIDEQGKLTPALRAAIEAAPTKQELEDLYLPYKQKRRTKGQIAREFGIEPLADQLWADPTLDPQQAAQPFVKADKGEGGEDFTTTTAVLDGVRDILSERWAEDAALVQNLREWLWAEGLLKSSLAAGKNEHDPEVAKFRDYFDYDEPIGRVPSHRALAVFRGRQLEILDAKLIVPEAEPAPAAPKTVATPSLAEGRIALHLGWSHQGRAADELLRKCVAWTWRVKLSLSTERELFTRLREGAEQVAIKVFADNLRDLLLAAPAGQKVVMGLDPGIRTGVKVAVVDATGKLLETATVYPHEPRKDWDGSLHTLARLVVRHGVQLIAIGNGTASRETDKLAGDLIKLVQKQAAAIAGTAPAAIEKIVISEAGASVYSASEYASQELPDVDVSLRGAASIARRLQDPLAELVKIDPKSIGVGQYQHDVNQSALARTLDAVVEDCVNGVGVDLNTASTPLLARVSGLSPAVARAVVRWREQHGAFRSRQQLLQVSGLGPKTFEQSAGFLRIRGGDNPLDVTGVHPETYPVVEQIIVATGKPVDQLMGRAELLKGLEARAVRHRGRWRRHRQGHPGRAGKARPRPAPRLCRGALQRRRGRHRRPEGRHGAGGHGEQRRRLRRLRGPGRAPGRAGARQPAGQQVRERRARGGQDRPDREGEGAGGGRGPQAHQPDDEAGRAGAAPRRPARQPLRGRGPRGPPRGRARSRTTGGHQHGLGF
jgi:uncharacterized protein